MKNMTFVIIAEGIELKGNSTQTGLVFFVDVYKELFMWDVISRFLEPLELYPLYMREVSKNEILVYTYNGKRIKVFISNNSISSIQFQ